MSPVISFENVVKEYGGRKVISGLSFQIHSREVVGLLGQSGMGKTTILKIIAGLEMPSDGDIKVIAERVGYVFQEPRLLPWRTALENVMLPMIALGMNKKQAGEKANHFLGEMELSEFTHYYPSQLSGGMMQRVSLARAFATEPEVLLLDEPFSALDLQMKDAILSMIEERLLVQPMTVLYVSHSQEEVMRISNRIFMMSSGSKLDELPIQHCRAFRAGCKKAFLKWTKQIGSN